MAHLSREDILKLARLSRLKLSESEIEEFRAEISEILAYVDMLKDANVEGLKPTYQVTGLTNVTRNDETVQYGMDQLDLLKNVPEVEKDYIKVKRMIQ